LAKPLSTPPTPIEPKTGTPQPVWTELTTPAELCAHRGLLGAKPGMWYPATLSASSEEMLEMPNENFKPAEGSNDRRGK